MNNNIIELFMYDYEHINGDQMWSDNYHYHFDTDTKKITLTWTDGYYLNTNEKEVNKDEFLKRVDEVTSEVKKRTGLIHNGVTVRGSYTIYVPLSDDNRALISKQYENEGKTMKGLKERLEASGLIKITTINNEYLLTTRTAIDKALECNNENPDNPWAGLTVDSVIEDIKNDGEMIYYLAELLEDTDNGILDDNLDKDEILEK